MSARAQATFEAVDDAPQFSTVDPDDLADIYWEMYRRPDRVEQVHPAPTTAA
ncbi:hypothetical protein [Actinoalloteichus hymeniacidonis]|uniref:hypothetical protein n=1 Tax=Actinoalloteichus hymeniacidonis TaxID=340345 RepID=UPI00180A9884|nr:hypothetical protein [Actinoalloteichus hymeniacidonis]MBB5908818.1 hypothetical protein [Actinoalloteichus hymeniacidonis]